MTTDTALALLRDAAGNLYMAYNAFTRNDAIAWEPLKETADRITALLDSGIKDAGDDVVEPDCVKAMRMFAERGNDDAKQGVEYIDTLLSAYKRVCVERDEAVKRADFNGAEWAKSAEAIIETVKRAEKAEAERDEFRKDAERYRYFKQHLCEPHAIAHFVKFNNWHPSDAEYLRDLDAAIDSARNK